MWYIYPRYSIKDRRKKIRRRLKNLAKNFAKFGQKFCQNFEFCIFFSIFSQKKDRRQNYSAKNLQKLDKRMKNYERVKNFLRFYNASLHWNIKKVAKQCTSIGRSNFGSCRYPRRAMGNQALCCNEDSSDKAVDRIDGLPAGERPR